ncbi:hypothetical protein PHYBOEH_002558 [Phytophthora boehmeriae]|uniref:RxLR effector protein n=1 Tax=Phytophthora boehmeriae TaxID=109152 RepID=A0A8T1WXF4_9STRA|nr:hypothetical protein PHYBOEH_002558 [Phytophthora boehmeriae]
MRVSCFLLFATGALFLSGDVASATSSEQTRLMKPPPSDDVLPTRSLFSGEANKRALRIRNVAGGYDTAPEAEEERGFFSLSKFPSVKKIMKKMDLEEDDAIVVHSIAKGDSPQTTLTKMGVNPSFVTADGQVVYSKHDPVYQKYRRWAAWLQENYNL